ncbi:MAG: TonB-dependent receptor plug domain-containing protein [Methylophilaceae bacterium]
MKQIILFLLFFVAAQQHANAYDVAPLDLDEDDYMGEVPHVLSVSRLSQPKSDAPSAVTVIDRKMIRASGIVELPEIFRLVPGFYVGANAGLAHSTSHAVSYHGMTSAYAGGMQVLVDGRSVYSPLYGGVQWSELPLVLEDIERIEVTRGPNAASYGANSFFGVVNIITRTASEARGNSIIAKHGNGRNEAFYRHGGHQGDFSYRISAGYIQDDGLDTRNDFKRTRFINARADYQLGISNNIEFMFGVADGARGEGDYDQIVHTPRTKQMSNHHALVRWTHSLSDDSDFILQGYHSFERSDDKITTVNLRPLLDPVIAPLGISLLNDTVSFRNPVETERYDIEAQHNFAVGRAFRFVWGGSVRRDSMYAPYYLGTSKKDYFDLQRVFGHAEWRVHKKLLLNAGAMIEHNDFTGTDISPRVSANFNITPDHTLRFGFSSALRTPNYIEEKFNRSILVPTTDPNITLIEKVDVNDGKADPERIISREIGYLGKIGNVNIDARLFHDNIYDHIFRDNTPYIAPPGFLLITDPRRTENAVNSGNAEVNGFETQVKWQLARKTNLLLNYSHVRIRETKFELTRHFEESMPSNTISALFTHQFNHNWDASLAYYQTSEATIMGDGQTVDLIRRCDVRVARKFNSSRFNGEVSLVVDNIFNTHYLEFARNNEHKRRARLNVILNF